jgi:hypothetical protein
MQLHLPSPPPLLAHPLPKHSSTRPQPPTPTTQDAVRGDHGTVAKFLVEHDAKLLGKDGELIDLNDSPLSLNVRIFGEFDPDWEVDPSNITIQEKLGERCSRVCWGGGGAEAKPFQGRCCGGHTTCCAGHMASAWYSHVLLMHLQAVGMVLGGATDYASVRRHLAPRACLLTWLPGPLCR